MKLYRGIRYDGYNGWRRKVFVDEKPLDMRTDLLELSNAFEWGYGGSGPSQLALALLADHFQNQPDGDERAIALHYKFEREVIKKLPRPEWKLTSEEVERAIETIQSREDDYWLFPPK
jgi:hypothetical protein